VTGVFKSFLTTEKASSRISLLASKGANQKTAVCSLIQNSSLRLRKNYLRPMRYIRSMAVQTHPGVGALTALAFVLIIGKADRFECGKQIASYLGLVPSEESSG